MALLEIRNLCVDFMTAGGLFRAVDEVDIECEAGEILSKIGRASCRERV